MRSRDPKIRLRQIMDAHTDFAGRILRSYGVRVAELDDALQQVFLVVARRLADIDSSSERSFLAGTARRIAFRFRRSESRRREADVEVDVDFHAQGLDPESSALQTEAFEVISGILDDFPDDLRMIFVLFEIEELSTTEIADIVEIPRGTVASRLRRARELFKERIEQLEGGSPR